MKAMTVIPGKQRSAQVSDVPEPPVEDGPVLVRTRRIGICGTDAEIALEGYGKLPEGADKLVIGHESLGEVLEAPADSGFEPGDLVVGIVRRPDPVPCACCAHDQWDFCRNGLYTERGIWGRNGYGSERYRIRPKFAVKVDKSLGDLGVLLEPTSVVAKGWEQVTRIRERSWHAGKVVLITGAGPIGLLAALIAVQEGYETHVVDVATTGPKPGLVRDLGASYSSDGVEPLQIVPDIVIECTGIGNVVFSCMRKLGPDGVVCLTGLSAAHETESVDGDAWNEQMVLRNAVVFGTVNAARRHYEQGAEALAKADRDWLARLVTRTVPVDHWTDALHHQPDDVKVTVDLTS